MARGIEIDNNATPRTLNHNGDHVADGGSANSAGMYAVGDKLYVDGLTIAEASADELGILDKLGSLYFRGEAIGSSTPTPVDPPTPPTPVESELWIPPAQSSSSRTPYSYTQLIGMYDTLKDSSNYTGTITKTVYSEQGYGDYDLIHYTFTPTSYTKTFYVQACIHGNEHDAPQTLYRIMDILCNHCGESAYSRLASMRDNVRFIVVPVVSPWGYDNNSMNIPYMDWDGETWHTGTTSMNPNRNMDVNHQYSLASAGTGGNHPYQVAETRHIKHIIDTYGAQNIDYCVDYHDGESVTKHFWMSYNADGANAPVVRKLLADLIEYEEELIAGGGTDYRAPNDTDADEDGWVHPDVVDAFGYSTGVCGAWFNGTTGMMGSVCEYLGGYFGYSFSSEQMTRSLRFRANILLYAYEMISTKGWRVNESEDADYFHFDYPFTMTRQGLRKDGSDSTNSYTITSQTQVYDRWNALATNYPSYVSKSASLGQNYGGMDIYSYTLGNGNKKVLFIGGSMRFAVSDKQTEYGMYVLAEYLCNDYVVNQSSFLQTLKQDYTIVVIPCIDINSGDNSTVNGVDNRQRSLNNSFAGATAATRWKISSSKCVPYNDSHADVNIFKSWVDSHSDALVLVSGGERASVNSSTGNANLDSPNYSTTYMTQVIIPKNYTAPQWLSDYCDHLENDRGEDAPDVENTAGLTCGDYAYDNHGIPAFFINLNVSNMWAERQQYMQSGDTSANYMYRSYETGRRIANIANFFLMAGGDIS